MSFVFFKISVDLVLECDDKEKTLNDIYMCVGYMCVCVYIHMCCPSQLHCPILINRGCYLVYLLTAYKFNTTFSLTTSYTQFCAVKMEVM